MNDATGILSLSLPPSLFFSPFSVRVFVILVARVVEFINTDIHPYRMWRSVRDAITRDENEIVMIYNDTNGI